MAKKLKIVFLSRFLGTVNRGAETYVWELSQRLSKNHHVDILKGADSNDLGKFLFSGYDLVIPTNGRMQALKACLGRTVGGYQTLISGQAGIGADDIFNILVTLPNVYVALTDYEMTWAKNWTLFTKVVKIPNGVDLDKFSPHGGGKLIDLEKPIILSVGALEWYKHHDRTIQAISKLKVGSLLLVGSGHQKNELENLGKNLLGNKRFKILTVNYQDLPAYYRSASLFVLPSWDRESFGIVYLEAMASGLPVVAPDDPPRREIIGDAGVFVDVENSDGYAQAISLALKRSWATLPRRQAEKFSWDEIGREYNQLFKEMFNR